MSGRHQYNQRQRSNYELYHATVERTLSVTDSFSASAVSDAVFGIFANLSGETDQRTVHNEFSIPFAVGPIGIEQCVSQVGNPRVLLAVDRCASIYALSEITLKIVGANHTSRSSLLVVVLCVEPGDAGNDSDINGPDVGKAATLQLNRNLSVSCSYFVPQYWHTVQSQRNGELLLCAVLELF